jgi:hypothetical protein
MNGYPINTALLTTRSLHVQNYDGSERVHICTWPSEWGMVEPAMWMEDADVQLRLAGWVRNHGWTYCPIKTDGMTVSIRPIS